MSLDLFASLLATIVAMTVGAAISSPFIAQSGAMGAVRDAVGGGNARQAEPSEPFVAGGTQFAMPLSWGRVRAAASEGALGTMVGSLCPAGSAGGSCAQDVQLNFIAYSGSGGESMPAYEVFEQKLDKQLAGSFTGFTKTSAEVRDSDAGRYLRYEFTFRHGGVMRSEVLAAYRSKDASGVVAMGVGPAPAMKEHGSAIDALLDGATRDTSADATH